MVGPACEKTYVCEGLKLLIVAVPSDIQVGGAIVINGFSGRGLMVTLRSKGNPSQPEEVLGVIL